MLWNVRDRLRRSVNAPAPETFRRWKTDLRHAPYSKPSPYRASKRSLWKQEQTNKPLQEPLKVVLMKTSEPVFLHHRWFEGQRYVRDVAARRCESPSKGCNKTPRFMTALGHTASCSNQFNILMGTDKSWKHFWTFYMVVQAEKNILMLVWNDHVHAVSQFPSQETRFLSLLKKK